MAIRRPKTPTCPTEDQDQAQLVAWLDKNHILFYAIPNGGKRSLTEGYRLKRTGVKAGVPDICIPVPFTHALGDAEKTYHGLYIELKRLYGGKISNAQLEWVRRLRQKGYCAEIAKGFDEAKAIVMEYLDMYNKN